MPSFLKLTLSIPLYLLLVLAGCSSQPTVTGVYRPDIQDSGPDRDVDVSNIKDVIPIVEPRTAAGNKSPYTVLGKTYRVMASPENYSEVGISSWYGTKFHGRKTSNGEVYDMYALTAAHKTLPIPCYVRVTNLDNNRVAIIRVNDRGPFHGNRIIDLSYSAAKKLRFANKGTARVKVEYVVPKQPSGGISKQPGRPSSTAGHKIPPNSYLQLGAFKEQGSAETLKRQVSELTKYPVNLYREETVNSLFKVRVGPLKDNFDLMQLRQKVIELGLASPHIVYWDGKDRISANQVPETLPEEVGTYSEPDNNIN